ncbi:MAG: hypothetical protein H6867_04465 [Rhodospirillales bacterium]|nr:hypothetical protein [Rhodospirillales bacterium]MCB9996404.1 hypothetical protein [Rhodospirillales bacterium]
MNTMFSRRGERGNVLFLVLIAVILFAALSYAVTRSTRQPNGRDDGIDRIVVAELSQYPATVRMGVTMMTVENVAPEELAFNAPADFGDLSRVEAGVFHPGGGGIAYQMASAAAMESGAPGQWFFNAEFEIEYLGLEVSSDFAGNDIVAFLPGVKRGVCSKVNDHIGISPAIPDISVDLSGRYRSVMDEASVLPGDEVVLGAAGGNGSDILSGQPFACFRNNGGEYVYYQVLVER